MPYQFLRDIGPAGEIRKAVGAALADDDYHGTTFLVLDKPRTVRINRTQRLKDETVVHTEDVEDGATVVIHIPFDNSSAQADIITHLKGEH